MSELLTLSTPQNGLDLKAGETRIVEGTPVKRIKRFLVKCGGSYQKDTKKEKWSFTADEARCAHWLSQWDEMAKDGIPIKATLDHKDPQIAANVMGDISQIGRDGDWLFAHMDIRGAENIRIAEANKDVSVEIFDVRGGNGKTYADCIRAVTFTGCPVVSGQPIAASTAESPETEIMSLSLEAKKMPNKLYSAIAKLADVHPDTIKDDDGAIAHIENHVGKCRGMRFSIEDPASGKLLSLVSRSAESSIDAAAAAGVLTPNAATALKQLIVGEKKTDGRVHSKLCLSMAADDAEEVLTLTESLLKIIRENKPVAVGEGTPGQAPQLLSRVEPDGPAAAPTKTKTPRNAWVDVYGPKAGAPAAK